MNQGKLPVLCIVGPTATGKSDLGVLVAKAVNGEILSADSMQVYRKMDIGTAKLSLEEMQGIPHHLIDLVDPDESFTVAKWTQEADKVIADLHKRGVLPIVVGGTGLYIRSITHNLDFAREPGETQIREYWRTYLEAHGPIALHQELEKRDLVSAQRLHPNDTRRVTRALEIIELTNKPVSESYDWERSDGRYRVVQFGLTMDRGSLYERVNRRVDIMMDKGLLQEVKDLLQDGYTRDLTSMQAIGYKELVTYLSDEQSMESAVEQIKQNTRRFVKRQLSWFRRNDDIVWLEKDSNGELQNHQETMILNSARELAEGIHIAQHE